MCKETQPSSTSVIHPLESLNQTEIATAAAIVKDAVQESVRFETIELHEPQKSYVRDFQPGSEIVREAIVSIYKLNMIGVWIYTVSLTKKEIISVEHHEKACPMIQLEEFKEIEDCCKNSPEFVDACKKRGIEDVDLVCVDPWSAGAYQPGEEGKHVCHAFCWLKSSTNDNLYAHPIEGLHPVVDIKSLTIVRIDDFGGEVPIPIEDCNYETKFQKDFRNDLKPIDVIQPEGVSFSFEGKTLKWHEWSMIVGFNAREGLTLHNISYAGRPILYRASIAEMVVPYGSPLGSHFRKNVFEYVMCRFTVCLVFCVCCVFIFRLTFFCIHFSCSIGEYGIGKLANQLTLGCDCLGSIHYMDAWITDINGNPFCLKNAVCIHEEDSGVLWKHWDFRTDKTEIRRGRRLVLSFISTVGNYEYGSYWYFQLDGTIEYEIKATGIINTVACNPYAGDKYGTEVMPGVFGQIHQHHFSARLDWSIDGDKNTVMECDTIQEPFDAASNPHGNAYYVEETAIRKEGGRSIDPYKSRFWKFISNEKSNHMGKPTAYKLEPVHSVVPYTHPDSPSGKRMPFIYKQLWVTPYTSNERFPAGHFMNHSDGSDGIHVWTKKERSTENTDVVAWYTFGLHHPVRLEDFPVQPVVSTGFMLMPSGFFDRNPCLDLLPGPNKASTHASLQSETCCNGNME